MGEGGETGGCGDGVSTAGVSVCGFSAPHVDIDRENSINSVAVIIILSGVFRFILHIHICDKRIILFLPVYVKRYGTVCYVE